MNLIKEIAILCLLIGSIDCQDSSNEDTTSTGEPFITLIDIITNEDFDSNSTEINTDETFITSIDNLTSEGFDTNTTEVSHKDTIYTGEPVTEINNITDNQTVSTFESNKTTLSYTTLGPAEVTPTRTVVIASTACSSSPCRNNGTCRDDPTNKEVYSCKCSKGFTGTRCQVVDECVPGTNDIVCYKGACVYESDGLSRTCKCFYGMFWDDDKKECSERMSPCHPNPCLHDGICEEDKDGIKCHCPCGYEGDSCNIVTECGLDHCEFGKWVTKDNTKLCECNQNFYWNEKRKTCEAVEPPCIPNPCKNQGQCQPLSKGFNCTCPYSFIGQTCDIQDFCVASDEETTVCKNGECVEADGSRKCHCNEGYFLNEDSYRCEEINPPCHPNPCKNDGICIPLSSNLYNCTCSEGFTGNSCTDLDFCVLDGGNAFCGGATCKNNRNSPTFYCSCESGQYFDYVSRTCNEIDFCPLMSCKINEVCEYSTCTCKEHYKWNNSSGLCESHFCSSNPCPIEDFVCSEGVGIKEYECACKTGYAFDGTHCKSGSTCRFPNLNTCGQICENSADPYSCKCKNEFELKEDNTTCVYFGNSTCSNKTCSLGACVVDGTETCICPPGFKEVEGECKDLCSAGALPEGLCPENRCETIKTGFRCKCEGKYKLSNDKATCTVRKMCEVSEEGWKTCSARNAICMEEWSSDVGYRCHCGSGLVEAEDGNCLEICSIEENQKICSMFGAKCDIDANGNRTCKCPPYFQPFEEGKVCNKPAQFSYTWSLPLNPTVYEKTSRNPVKMERQANTENIVDYEKAKRDIQEAVNTLIPGLLHINVLSYIKSKNYILFKVEMQFSSITNENLKRLSSPELCQTDKNPSSCLISPSLVVQKDYVKDFVTVLKTDPCDVDIKDALCESETLCFSSTDDASFNCTCKAGFAVRNKMYPFGTTKSSIESCRDIDECSQNNPCPQNMKCQNTFGSYECSCKSGYRVDKDSSNEKCVEVCNPNPCVHGLCTELSENDFQCRCDAGYRGTMCDLQDENFKRARTNTIVVGAVLGGALLVTIIFSYAFISRLKKRKYLDDPDNMLYGTEMTERRNVDSGAINNAYQRD